ncbi:UNVERIFIED_CONTAM: hypothetical protein NY603_41050, partial [Bacteroidetes bacterium 56_B9]
GARLIWRPTTQIFRERNTISVYCLNIRSASITPGDKPVIYGGNVMDSSAIAHDLRAREWRQIILEANNSDIP